MGLIKRNNLDSQGEEQLLNLVVFHPMARTLGNQAELYPRRSTEMHQKSLLISPTPDARRGRTEGPD